MQSLRATVHLFYVLTECDSIPVDKVDDGGCDGDLLAQIGVTSQIGNLL